MKKKIFKNIKGTKEDIEKAIYYYNLMSAKNYKKEIKELKQLLKQYS